MAIKLRGKRFWYQHWIPTHLQASYGGRTHIDRNLETSDAKVAAVRAAAVRAELMAEFADKRAASVGDPSEVRRLYLATLERATAGAYQVSGLVDGPYGAAEPMDPVAAGIDFQIERMADAIGEAEPSPADESKLAALQDAAALRLGRKPKPRPEYEPAFSEVATEHMCQWRAEAGRKASNTSQQKEATFALFAGFWEDKPIRNVRQQDGAAFFDALRLLDPRWARTPQGRDLPWPALIARFGNTSPGLAQSTLNRHVAAMKALWEWARKRGHCTGDNPFDGFRKKVRGGVNAQPYVAWETAELHRLLTPRPRREDLLELTIVGMHSAMRINEAASLTWGQIREADGIPYFQIEDAKTPAGNRQVPVHPALSWLLERQRGADSERIWPGFNGEGPGKKPGADASREFSRVKAQRGFHSRQKGFHSFRKNVTRIMEQAGVSENDWAQVFGHERGFTYKTYNPDGITLQRKADLIGRIAYPGLVLPEISAETRHPAKRPLRRGA